MLCGWCIYERLNSYADDMILLTPSWSAMQQILELLEKNCITHSILCNTKKTVRMVFNPKCVSKVVSLTFPPFTPCGVKLKFVTNFKYLGHIIKGDMQRYITKFIKSGF